MTYRRFQPARVAVSLISMLLISGSLLPAVARASVLTDAVNYVVTVVSSTVRGNVASADTVSTSRNIQTEGAVKAAMNIDPSPDTGGGDLTYTEDGSAVVAESGLSGTYVKPANSRIYSYTVHEGDTVSQIADMFDVTPSTILWANDLPKGASLKAGQTLTILPVTGVKYTVRKGDTLATIAKSFDGDATEIASYNGIDDATLVLGQEIIIPNGEISVPATPAKPKSQSLVSKLAGKITNTVSVGYFSSPLAHYIRTQGIHGYNGVDLAAPVGTPIMAAAEGDVIVAKQGGYNGGYGSYVVIQHANGSQTLYGHQSRVIVSVGQHVVKGQVIGAVGNTGRVSGPTGYHLHFEVRNGGRNPMADTPVQI